MRGVILVILVGTILLFPLAQITAQETGKNLEKLGKEAIAYYENNELEKAIVKFNEWLLAQPSDREALRLRELAGTQLMMQMLMRGGEVSRVARAILLYAEKAPVRRETRFAEIKKLVDTAATGNLYQRNEAIALLEAQVGERAVPMMLPYLANKTKDQERINIILAVTKLGRTVVVPLIEALNTPDSFLKQQVAILLGHIGDIRALADLKRVLETPNIPEEVKKYAEIAIQQIIGKPAIALPPAKQLYYQKALNFYNDNPDYKPVLTYNWQYWRWQDDQLAFQEVPSFAYNEIMAEHACHRALELDPNYQFAWALLARVYYAQYTEIKAVEEASKEKGLQLPDTELAKFLKEKPYGEKAKTIAAAVGPDILYLALKAALSPKENRPEVTVKILEDIGEACKGRERFPRTLMSALLHKDKRIRYAAAEAIVKIAPRGRFAEARRVVRVLKEALGEWDSRVVLVVEDDDASRNKLIDVVRNMKMVVFGAANGLEGIKRAKSFPPEDLIIVSSKLKDISTPYIVNSLRDDYRTRDIPVLVITPQADKENALNLYQKIAQVKGFIIQPYIDANVEAAIRKGVESSKSDYKSRAREIAKRAVEALASLDTSSYIFRHLKDARDALAEVLLTRHDSIRLPAIQALGNLAEAQTAPALLQLVVDKEATLDIRLQAAWALGQIFNHNPKMPVSDDDVNRLMGILQEKPTKEMEDSPEKKGKLQKLQHRAYYLLGRANISPLIRRKVFEEHRVHKTVDMIAQVKVEAKPEKKKPEKVEKKPKKEKKKEYEIWDEEFKPEGVPEKKGTEKPAEEEVDWEEF